MIVIKTYMNYGKIMIYELSYFLRKNNELRELVDRLYSL